MKNVDNNKYKQLEYELSYFNQENSPCNGIENVSIIVHKKKVKNRKKYNMVKYGQQPAIAFRLSRSGTHKYRKLLTKHSSMPEINKRTKLVKQRTRSSDAVSKKRNHFLNSKLIVNRVSEYHFKENLSPFQYPIQKKWKVYRCQISTNEESCCCSCNSDAMFEVMKSLYDCYKKKNCDNCNCILCGHLPREERRLGEVRKSLASVGLAGSTKERKEKIKKAEKMLEGKSTAEKEKILKELAMSGQPLPVGKTASEKSLIRKVRTELGLPPEPKTSAERARMRKAEAAGVITPLEGKTTAQKEEILKAQAKLGIKLPEGRTASERALIQKVKTAAGIIEGVPSEKLRKAKEAGLLTPLEGKSPEQREKILKGLAMQGLPLPEGKTTSEKKIIEKVRADLGLPPEPKTPSMRERYANATNAGLMQPLEGKSAKEKERILQGLADMGIPLPEGRTASEKSLIAKVRAGIRAPSMLAPSEKMRKAKEAGLLTPLEAKSPEQKEKILRGLAMHGIPLPEGKTASERKLINKVRADLGLPPEPKTSSMRDKYARAANAGLMQPLEGKSPKEKKRILQGLYDMGIPLPEGRTASEKALIAKVTAGPRAPTILTPSEKVRKAKAAGLLTPLEGKTTEQKEKILKGLAMQGIPLPEGKTASERKLIDKVRTDLGLPPEPKTSSMRKKYISAADAGFLQPLEGKTPKEKERILQGLHDMGIPLPEGRTASERSLIAKVKAGVRPLSVLAPSEKLRKAKAAGLLTPLEGKTPEQREKILRGLAMEGIPLPEGKTASERKIIDKVRADLGLPPEPKTPSMRDKYARAADAGLLQPLEGKSSREKEKILQGLHDMGIPLPEGRTSSEKALIAKVKARPRAPSVATPSEKLRKAKAAGLLTPLEGKTPEQKEKILKGLAMQGIPLPEGKTASERKLIDKVRADLGLPPEPKTPSMRNKYTRAADVGLLQPLEGKSLKEKERILQGLYDMGIPLPEGRTASERSLIAKVKAGVRPLSVLAPSEKLRKAKAAGLLTPLEGKTPEQREKILRGLAMEGIPLPEGKTASERKIIDKVRADLGLPPEPKTPSMRDKYARAADAGLLQPLEGKSSREKEKILQGLHDMGIPLPEGRTSSEKALIAKVKAGPRAPSVATPSEKIRKAKAAGLLTPLEGKTPEQKEKILKGLAMQGIPLPEGKTASERKLIDKVRADLGLPPEPKTPSMRNKYTRAADVGLLQPLEGKSPKEKERILQGLYDMGIPLPEGRTASERSLIAKVKAGARPLSVLAPSEKLRKAKAAGLLTPLEGKTPEQREKILRGLAMEGIPLPEGKTASERKIIGKVRADLGLPPEPKTPSMRDKYARAADAGLLQPLEGKSSREKEKILQGLHDMGIPLPEGRTSSEKALIAKVKAGRRAPSVTTPSERLRKAKAAGLLTPLEGKTPEQKEKILKGLAMQGIPLPEGKTASERKLIDKVRADLGLPPEPKTPSMRNKYTRAADVGLLQPLEGKSPKEKERILQGLYDMGIPLPEGRTASEKALIAKVKASPRPPSVLAPSEKLRRAKAAGLLTPLAGKSPAQREKILRGLAMQGVPLPEAKTVSEKMLIDKVRADLGLPPEPKTPSMRERYVRAADAGLLQPLEGKSSKEKERILQGLHDLGIPLPEGRTASEKALIAKVKGAPSLIAPSERLRRAKAAGLLTPLEGKSPAQKEKILRGLAMQGIPLPEGKTASERKLIDKIRTDLGLPPEPKTPSMKEKYAKAANAGLMQPLEGKSSKEKERIIQGLHDMGIPLPEGRTSSEKALIAKVKARAREPSMLVPSEKLRKAKAAGLLTPLEGKTAAQQEKILRGLAVHGIPLPEGKTTSEKMLIDKVRADLGLPPAPKTASEKEKYNKAVAAGLITPLEGKSTSEKEKILRGQAAMGLPLPEGRTSSEKAMIARIRASAAPSITTEKLRKAKAAGLLTPLEGKTSEQKEKILKGLVKSGLPLPEGRTASEKALIKKIKTELGVIEVTPSEKVRKARLAGVLTPLEGKTLSQKEKILRGRAAAGLPLPVGKTPSERALIQKIKEDTGYISPTPSQRMKRAKAAGLLTPLEGKTPSMKEKILRERIAAGVPIPEGRTPSEREIIRKITAGPSPARPSERLRRAKAAGLLTPLEGKSPEQKEKILRGLVKAGIPLPEPKTASERNLMEKIRQDVGLPPEPRTPSLKEKYRKAQEAGLITPLEGKTPAEKERILKRLHEAGIPLPEARTPSEKSMIKRIKTGIPVHRRPSEKLRAAEAAGLMTPLTGKTPAQKEKILKGLAKAGIPLPEGRTASEKELIRKVRNDMGLPPEPATASLREKMNKAQAAGIITPLEGKTKSDKEKILRGLVKAGIPLPEGRTSSEKSLIAKIKAVSKRGITSEKMRRAKAAGLLTPLKGKTAKEKEKIMRGLIEQGLPLPEAQTASEKKIAEKIRKEIGLPPEPRSSSERERMRKAQAAGIITPLEGKTTSQKERILRNLAEAGVTLPEGRTASERSMIRKIQAEVERLPSGPPSKRRIGPPALPPEERKKLDKKTAKVMKEGKGPSDECICSLLTPESEREEAPRKLKALIKIPSEKLRRAKAAGLLTPLQGKTTAQKEKILRGLAKEGIPLPEAKTSSERKLIEKIRKDLGLPPEPKTASMREKHEKAAAAGVLVPLEGLSPAEKERVLRAQADIGLPLPEGRTASEKALIAKVKAEGRGPPPSRIPSEKIRRAKAAGLLTPLEGKTTAQKENILRGLAREGMPLPEARTSSERKLIDKIRKDLGLPPEPKTASMREKHEKAAAAGVLVPLEGLSPAEKERVLRAQADIGLPLPEGRTASEKALIAKVKAEGRGPPPSRIPSEKIRRAKAAGLLTPLEGKSKAQKEKILRGLAKEGIPLPEAKTSSERKLIDKIRKDLGLPPEPKTASMREKHEKAAAAGILVPLEGLSPEEKERVLRAQADIGLPLPEGRTASEKALIAKVKAEGRGPPPSRIPSEKMRRAKAAGLLTPLEGKSKAQKEKILRGLAKEGIPLPEAKTSSERKLIDKIRKDLGLPPEPKTASMRDKHEKAAAAGVLVPLEGLSPEEKERVLRAQADIGLPLPEGRTASEKALIAKVKAEGRGPPPSRIPSEKMRRAKAAGLLTPLEGKSKAQKEKILRGLAKEGIPLPEAKTSSERKLIDKIRKDLGLPPEPKTASMRDKHEKAAAAGVLVPLEGLSPEEKERVLRAQADIGLPLPEGRTASEKALIAKVKAEGRGPPPSRIPSEKMRRAKAAGLLTPLEGKSKAQKEKILRGLAKEGIPLPEAKTPSERKLIDKIRKDLGLPPEPKTASMRDKHEKAAAAGVLVPLEGLSPEEKERVLRAQADIGLPLPEGRTASEKALIAKVKAEGRGPPPSRIPSEKMRRAKAAGLLTPLEGKSKAQKEKILRGLAKEGIPLPEAKTSSERKLIDKIRKDLGLPPEPKTASMREKHEKAAAAGVLVPLEGLSPAEKERVLRAQADIGLPLPEGRTASEKALIAKVKAEGRGPPPSRIPSEKIRRAKAAGLLTPLEGKTTAQKENILRGLAREGIPLPEAKTSSERKLIDKIRKDLGLPPEPKTASMKEKHEKAAAAGVLVPLEGLSPAEKERVLRAQADIGLALPEGRTASEKALIAKVKAEGRGPPPSRIPSEKIRRAKAAGLLTPLEGKTTAQKENILRGLAREGIPLPEAKTSSERKLIDKIRKDLGLPPEPKTASMREKHEKAAAAGVLVPLEGLSPAEKERVLRAQADIGLPLPEGRTASEKALIAKVKAEGRGPPPSRIPSEKMRKAKAAGLLTPLEGKSKAQKEKILRGLAKEGIPLPEAKTSSERKLIDKIRKDLGLPPEPKTASMREKHQKAAAAGVLVPLEGLSPAEKERVLRAQADIGLPLPEGRTASEKALIAKVKAEGRGPPPSRIPSEKMRRAKAAGLLTPLEGKTTAQKEKILRGLAKEGIPLPEAKTSSERKLIDKIRKDLGLPPEPKTASMREKHEKAAAAGVLVPLEGLSPSEKERVLRAQADIGLPLPEGRTASEKALIAKVKAEGRGPPPSRIPSEKMRRAKAAGLLTPLEGKTTAQKEKILRGLAKEGIPLPEAKTSSEKKLIDKIRKDLGLPPEPKTASMREKHEKAAAAGVLVPLEGLSPAEKERVLRTQADMGIALPEGRTASEKALIAKIKAEEEPSKIPSEKLRKAKAAGLLTPLEGKTHAQKEKIIRSLAEAGLPLPEGKTSSEKSLIHKIRTELGIPPPARTPSEKAVVRKARAEGLLTPLAGKSAKEKERILKGLAEAGLPMPEGRTASEKELIKKVRTAAGLPPEPTPSEKRGEIKTKSKRVGVTPSKRIAKGIGVGTIVKAGIGEEFEDIIKTTTCDRGCGCDKKKIRFKHSYVKIRVTSPDISSLCPCPDECVPGVKAGAFIDNEGIKVTVGIVAGVPSYTSQYNSSNATLPNTLENSKNVITLYDKIPPNWFNSNTSIDTIDACFDNTLVANDLQKTKHDNNCASQKCFNNNNKENRELSSTTSYTSDSYDIHSSKQDKIESDKSNLYNSSSPYEECTNKSDRFLVTYKYLGSSEDPVSMSYTSDDYTAVESSRGSFDSILVIKSESSLSLATTNSSASMEVISVISFSNGSSVSESTHYLLRPVFGGNFSDSTIEDLECYTKTIDYSEDDTITSDSNDQTNDSHINPAQTIQTEYAAAFTGKRQNEYFTYRFSQTKLGNAHNMNRINTRKNNNGEPVIVINHLNSEHDVTTMVDELLSKNEFSDASSIFVIVPTSDDNDSDSSSGSLTSTICIHLSEYYSKWNQPHIEVEKPVETPMRIPGLRISSKGRKFFLEGMQETGPSFHNKETTCDHMLSHVCIYSNKEKMKNKLCQMYTPRAMLKQQSHGVGTDTTADRPCCCPPKEKTKKTNYYTQQRQQTSSNNRCVAKVVSELITPLLVTQGLNSDTYRMPKKKIHQQASFISITPTPVTTCRIPPCSDLRTHHVPSDMPPKVETVAQNKGRPCTCSPEKLKELFKQAFKSEKPLNMKSIGCGGAAPQPKPVLRQPSPEPITSFIGEEDCATCSQPKRKDGTTLKCSCSGKRKTIKLRPLCPCEQHQPPMSKTMTGPKTGTRSLGCQCCACEDSSLAPLPGDICPKNLMSRMGPPGVIDVLGPMGGFSHIEPGGTYTQAGFRQPKTSTAIETSTTPRKDCTCRGKRGKKKKNIICECPPVEWESVPQSEPTNQPALEPESEPLFSYEQYEEFMLLDAKEALKQKSDMTQTHSGFKFFKKKKPQLEPEPEMTIEDAVRYYATVNPNLLRDLVPAPPPPQEYPSPCEYHDTRDYKDCTCEAKKPKKRSVKCECPFDELQSFEPLGSEGTGMGPGDQGTCFECPASEPDKEEESPLRGFKFSMGGKGSGSKGLSGVCCFDMIQEISRTRSRCASE